MPKNERSFFVEKRSFFADFRVSKKHLSNNCQCISGIPFKVGLRMAQDVLVRNARCLMRDSPKSNV